MFIYSNFISLLNDKHGLKVCKYYHKIFFSIMDINSYLFYDCYSNIYFLY